MESILSKSLDSNLTNKLYSNWLKSLSIGTIDININNTMLNLYCQLLPLSVGIASNGLKEVKEAAMRRVRMVPKGCCR